MYCSGAISKVYAHMLYPNPSCKQCSSRQPNFRRYFFLSLSLSNKLSADITIQLSLYDFSNIFMKQINNEHLLPADTFDHTP
ncbi:hypothetical protein HanIR_Chr08g0365501 [Helianthus annuus]|nr:hypothetical protein HanIR_Chr08g0365501 [Helianthus annuus]